MVVQHPNFFGCLEEVEALAAAAHDRGALFIVSFDPISLGLLKRPGQYGADIAVAEGQCLGNPMAYGGPYLGLLACREQFVRKMPGRLVGQTVDRNGKRCWVLTLQTREQHIRREKATSNICTNQGLMALQGGGLPGRAGAAGAAETAELVRAQGPLRRREADEDSRRPAALSTGRSSRNSRCRCPAAVPGLLDALLDEGYHAGLHLGRWYAGLDDCLSVAVTEKRTRAEIDGLAAALAKALAAARPTRPAA